MSVCSDEARLPWYLRPPRAAEALPVDGAAAVLPAPPADPPGCSTWNKECMKALRSCATVGLAAIGAAAAGAVVLAAVVPVAAVMPVAELVPVACDPTTCCSDCIMLLSRGCEAPTGIWPTLPTADSLWDSMSEPFFPCPRPCGRKLTVGSALDAALAMVIDEMEFPR